MIWQITAFLADEHWHKDRVKGSNEFGMFSCMNCVIFWGFFIHTKSYLLNQSCFWSPTDRLFSYISKFELNCSLSCLKRTIPGRALFLYFRLNNTVDLKQMFYKKLCRWDWVRIADLWCQKRPLYQLSHNHCPTAFLAYHSTHIACYIAYIYPYFHCSYYLDTEGTWRKSKTKMIKERQVIIILTTNKLNCICKQSILTR